MFTVDPPASFLQTHLKSLISCGEHVQSCSSVYIIPAPIFRILTTKPPHLLLFHLFIVKQNSCEDVFQLG